MKNILGTTEKLKLYDKDQNLIYMFYKNSNGFSYESTYDSNGNVLTYKNSGGFSRVF